MSKILAYQVDAFTRQRFEGNAAGVVPDAEGLSDEQMQKIAAEFNNSETAFVFPPDASDHDLRIRFFTPTTEVPSCGHATIAAHYVRARERRLPKCKITHRIGVGILPVEIHPENGEYKIIMYQAVPTFEDLHEDHQADVLEALGISGDDLDRRCPVEIASTGHSKVMVGLNSREMMNRIVPNLGRLRSLSEKIGCNGYFVFTSDSNDSRILTHARMFAPAIGIGEDPVTGNGNGPLGAYLVRHGLNGGDNSLFHFHSRQGEAMGRPGEAEIWVDSSDGEPTGVRVGGYAVIAFRAQFEI